MNNFEKINSLEFNFQEVALVGVTYNSAPLASFFAETAKNFKHVWIIDNCSQDGTVSAFIKKIPHARVIKLKENIGFGPANNHGFEMSLPFCNKVIFLNPDCKIDEASVRLLLKALDSNDSVAIASPVVFSDATDGANLKLRDYSKGYGKVPIESMKYSLGLPFIIPEACLDGACFAVDSRKFKEIGAFDENIFMYSEEDDISLRIFINGFKKVTVRDAHAQHIGGASSGASLRLSLRKKYHHRWSVIYMTRKYLGIWQSVWLSVKTIVIFPLAMLIYAVTLDKKNIIKWVAWFLAASDGIFSTKIFAKLL